MESLNQNLPFSYKNTQFLKSEIQKKSGFNINILDSKSNPSVHKLHSNRGKVPRSGRLSNRKYPKKNSNFRRMKTFNVSVKNDKNDLTEVVRQISENNQKRNINITININNNIQDTQIE